MSTINLELEDELVAFLSSSNQPIERAVRELMILELYRRGVISSGKAAELLKMAREQFIRYASQLGIPFFDMTEDEWRSEGRQVRTHGRLSV
jgi:predicted HTH domain antitoxin